MLPVDLENGWFGIAVNSVAIFFRLLLYVFYFVVLDLLAFCYSEWFCIGLLLGVAWFCVLLFSLFIMFCVGGDC